MALPNLCPLTAWCLFCLCSLYGRVVGKGEVARIRQRHAARWDFCVLFSASGKAPEPFVPHLVSWAEKKDYRVTVFGGGVAALSLENQTEDIAAYLKLSFDHFTRLSGTPFSNENQKMLDWTHHGNVSHTYQLFLKISSSCLEGKNQNFLHLSGGGWWFLSGEKQLGSVLSRWWKQLLSIILIGIFQQSP